MRQERCFQRFLSTASTFPDQMECVVGGRNLSSDTFLCKGGWSEREAGRFEGEGGEM